MRPIEFIATLVGATLIATLLVSLASLHAPQPDKPVVGSYDFISILLTAVTVVVAVLAIGIAILAIWGFKEFKNQAHNAAGEIAKVEVDAYLESPKFQAALRAAVEIRDREEVLAAAAAKGPQGSSNATGTPIPPVP